MDSTSYECALLETLLMKPSVSVGNIARHFSYRHKLTSRKIFDNELGVFVIDVLKKKKKTLRTAYWLLIACLLSRTYLHTKTQAMCTVQECGSCTSYL